MKILVMGTGALGGYYGGKLARSGEDVTFVARGTHLQTLLSDGLTIEAPDANFTVPVKATLDPSEVGPVDLVLFTVKGYDTETAAQLVRPVVGPQTMVLTLQNGLEEEDRLAAAFGPERVLGGVAYIAGFIAAPGRIQSGRGNIIFGTLDGRPSPVADAFLEACRKAEIDCTLTGDIWTALWNKVAYVGPIGVAGTLCRCPMTALIDEPEAKAVYEGLLQEYVQAAAAHGITIDVPIMARRLAMLSKVPGAMPSLQRDAEARRRLEVEPMIGVIVRKAQQKAVAVPKCELAYAAISMQDKVNRTAG